MTAIVILISLLHSVFVADLVEDFLRALADGVHVRLWMALVDGNELGTETEADNSDIYLRHACVC